MDGGGKAGGEEIFNEKIREGDQTGVDHICSNLFFPVPLMIRTFHQYRIHHVSTAKSTERRVNREKKKRDSCARDVDFGARQQAIRWLALAAQPNYSVKTLTDCTVRTVRRKLV